MPHPQLDLSNDDLLATTRAVRKRLDLQRPVPQDVLMECMELALQAPSGSNAQNWQFMFVTDADKRERIAALYRQAFADYIDGPMAPHRQSIDDREYAATQNRVAASAQYLADHLHQVPVFLIPCHMGRIDQLAGPGANMAQSAIFGSVLPAVWNFMLAARARGLGTCWTTLHLMQEQAVAEILDIPFDQVTQMALIAVAYTTGTTFKRGPRKDMAPLLHFNGW